MKISITKTTHAKSKPDENNLGFGQFFSDHLFLSEYNQKNGWFNSEIKPYNHFQIDPAASVFHYGQALFEGMKAFRQIDNSIALFRPEFNWKRMMDGSERLCLQCPPKEIFLEGLKELVKIDQDWVPKKLGNSLYLRPTLIGTEAFLGVRPSNDYLFFIIASPVGQYYSASTGLQSVKIWLEEDLLRAAFGGLGATKAAANYACSLKSSYEAKKKNYAQVLWLDQDRKNISEVGTMNIFFIINGALVTPKLDGTILPGCIRDSVIQIAKKWKLPFEERTVTLKELQEASSAGLLHEAFGTGTAAVISPVSEISNDRLSLKIKHPVGPLTQKLSDEITNIQFGKIKDEFGWIYKI